MPKISIKAARVNAGLTQEAAARQLGINPDTLARYERESGKLSLEMLRKIAGLYKIPVNYLK
ncbi:helix-turn-helix domain-containing protein [Lactobacillus delbrueckii]|uniref:helix-turn-helix domain-containing protein n=1 Tax=Lactobacillus delbrueckii TaxID=1584 RepID=UPI001E4879F8|nr:helix-turn-helix domain-containing protein [Lactobacillus delbrueckii subsp. lactis]